MKFHYALMTTFGIAAKREFDETFVDPYLLDQCRKALKNVEVDQQTIAEFERSDGKILNLLIARVDGCLLVDPVWNDVPQTTTLFLTGRNQGTDDLSVRFFLEHAHKFMRLPNGFDLSDAPERPLIASAPWPTKPSQDMDPKMMVALELAIGLAFFEREMNR